jgi:hypothetical protein
MMILKMQENDDFKNAKIFKIYQDLSNTRYVVYIGSTFRKCMSNFRIKSNSRVNWAHDKFYLMIRQSYINCKIDTIEDFPCYNAEELRKTKYMIN